MRETIDHATVTWMLPAWQTATLQQLLGMLVIASFLSATLAYGESQCHTPSQHDCDTSTRKFARHDWGNTSPAMPHAQERTSLARRHSRTVRQMRLM